MGVYENKIQQSLIDLKMDAIDFAAISGVNRSTLSLAFRNGHSFGNQEVLRLLDLVRELKQLQTDAQPFELSWKNTDNIKKLLEYRRNEIIWQCVAQPAEDEPGNQQS